jgi:hypothetical protein
VLLGGPAHVVLPANGDDVLGAWSQAINGASTMPRRGLVSSIRHEPGGEKAIVAVWVPCIATGN